MKSLSRLLLMMCACLLIGNGTAQAQYTTLDVPGASLTVAEGISGNNIVGFYSDGVTFHGFLYDGSRYSTLDVPGAYETLAYDISGHNIVGQYRNGTGNHGFLYDGSRYSTLDVPGSHYTAAVGISGNNIVGFYSDGVTFHGFLYEGSRYSTLDVPGASDTRAYGLSGNKIVGGYFTNGNITINHGFVYDGSRYTNLDVPGSVNGYPSRISGNNIVGTFQDSIGYHGYLYDGSRYTTLDVPGASQTEALGISGNNIVGVYEDGVGTHGFLFKPIALSLSNVTAVVIGPTTATVSWTTTTPASSVVEYGTTTSYGNGATDIGSATSHSVSLNILRPYTLYHYRVKSTDANGRTATSADGTFTTGPANSVFPTVRYSNVRRLPDGKYTIDVTVRNIGGGIPTFVNLDFAYLRVSPLPSPVTYPTSPNLPMGLGPLNGPVTITLTFPASAGSPGARLLLDAGGSFNDPANNLFFLSFYSYRAYVTLP